MTEQEFINSNRSLIDQVIGGRLRIKNDEQTLKGLKGQLQGSLMDAGLDGAEDDTCKLKIVGDSKTLRIDTGKLEKDDPALYASLLNSYLKIDTRTGYLMVKGKSE